MTCDFYLHCTATQQQRIHQLINETRWEYFEMEETSSRMIKQWFFISYRIQNCSTCFAYEHVNIFEYAFCTLSLLFTVSVTIFCHLHGLHHWWNRNVSHAMHALRLYAISNILKIAQWPYDCGWIACIVVVVFSRYSPYLLWSHTKWNYFRL